MHTTDAAPDRLTPATPSGSAEPTLTALGRWADDGGSSAVPKASPGEAKLELSLNTRGAVRHERLVLLDGGAEAYPRMLAALGSAARTIHLETYAFDLSGIGARFVDALREAALRGAAVHVVLDGWGSAWDGRAVAALLREVGCDVRIYNRLRSLLVGRFGRNHRKILLVDEEFAFIGGLNIGDENLGRGPLRGWADLTLQIEGPQCVRLGQMLRGERPTAGVDSAMSMHLCGWGGGWRLRRRYIRAFARARHHLYVAHGYFLPDPGMVRAITAAARRGVEVRLLLAGRTDVPFARIATRRLHARLLAHGVSIREWNPSVLHAKVATVDGQLLLVGSFNLDPFSLANLEALVEVSDRDVVAHAERWITEHFEGAREVTAVEANSRLRRWILDPLGYIVARLVVVAGRCFKWKR